MVGYHRSDVSRSWSSRALSWRAATLHERVAALRHECGPVEPDTGTVADGLAPWARSCAPDRPDFLARRLAWDAITPALAHRALTDADPPVTYTPETWTSELDEFCAEAVAQSGTVGSAAWEAEVARLGPAAPFADVWLPAVGVAGRHLERVCPAVLTALSPSARTALDRALLESLTWLGELALLDAFRTQGVPYRTFVRETLAAGARPLVETYPVLARQAVERVRQWVAATRAFVMRLDADRATLAATFGSADGPVAALTPGISDRHAGGQQVMRVTFASGLSVAYKPRGLALEQGLDALLASGRAGGLPFMRCLPVTVDRGAYGWAAWVEPAPPMADADLAAYYRTAGALVCLAWVLGGADLHGENVVAAACGPVLVDAEMLLQPDGASVDDHAQPENGRMPSAGSCLASGLVSAVAVDASGQAFDVGGLRRATQRTRVLPARRWHRLREDGIGYVHEAQVAPRTGNVPESSGMTPTPEAWAAAIVDGFGQAYRHLQALRDTLTGADGPLAALATAPVRVLFRPSDQYAALLHVLAAPAYQRRGIDRSLALERLTRLFAAEPSRPRLWDLVGDERSALEAFDIPRFTLRAGDTACVASDGTPLPPAYACSGLDAVRRRLAALSGPDLHRQVDRLREALTPMRPAAPAPRADDPGAVLVAAAAAIGERLLTRATQPSDSPPAWVALDGRNDLYGGAAGIGLFFAALAQRTGDRRWHAVATSVLEGLVSTTAEAPTRTAHGTAHGAVRLGACTGVPSVAYALALGGHLLEAPALVDAAHAVLGAVPDAALDDDTVLDVEGGVAGALLVATALLERRDDPRLRAVAARCAARLRATQVAEGADRGGWAAGDQPHVRPGFAHGAAGIAAALARHAAQTPDEAALDTVARAWAYERRVAAAHDGTWPTDRADGSRLVMAAWCHGAPGIALARCTAPARLAGADWAADLAAAMQQTLAAPPSTLDHLCCGMLGRADVALTVGLERDNEAWTAAAHAIAQTVAMRVLRDGRLGLRGRGFQHGAAEPGFFQGLAGIGYQLLRQTAPDTLPSVLAFAAPGAAPGVRPARL